MRRIALLILTLMPLLSQNAWAQPFVEIRTTNSAGGVYACEGLPMAVVAFPAQKGQGRWVVNHPDVLKNEGNVLALQPKQAGTSIRLTYELRIDNGTVLDTTITLTTKPTAKVAIEQQGDRLVVVGKEGHPAPTTYQWLVNGKIVLDHRNAPFEHPQKESYYSLSVLNDSGCTTPAVFVVK